MKKVIILLILILIVSGGLLLMEISFFSTANEAKSMVTPTATSTPTLQPTSEIAIEPTLSPNTKTIYLTFDDGPYIYTSKLLDYLDAYNVKATFFVTNQNSDYSYLIKEEYDRGHSIGVHTASHRYWQVYSSDQALADDINEMSDIIFNITGYRTNLYRFPGGSSNTVSRQYCQGIISRMAKTLEEQNYVYFDWDIASGDSDGIKYAQGVYQNCINQIAAAQSNEIIILQHDLYEYSVDAVPMIIQWGLDNGYVFDSLNEKSHTAHLKIAN